MEPWEFELEFLTWDAYERAIAKAKGKDVHIEEVEIDTDEFERQKQEFMQNTGGEFDSNQWEEIDG